MALPDEKVDEIRYAVNMVELVGDYVNLKPSGNGYKGLCPFHNESTPSFHIDPEKKVYHCFGCNEGGDVFSFVQEMEGVGFLESARWLAERAGVSLEQSKAEEKAASRRESIYHALRSAARFFYRQRTQSERGAPARRYLSERDFDADTLKTFGVGYAPDSWDALLNAAQEQHIKPEVLHDAGLIIERKSGSGYYDRYRGRVIFPIFSHIGKVVGFAGRILDADADQPKYINSPETEVYHKSDVLYGLYQNKKSIRRQEKVWVVEGYTDVIRLHQAGINHSVATCGTALTPEHVNAIKRYAGEVVLLFDSDEAGVQAALDGFNKVLSQELDAYVAQLPEGHDPDSYIQERGADSLKLYISKNQENLPGFLVSHARESGQMDTPARRLRVQSDILAEIARIPSPNLRDEYIREASDILGKAPIVLREGLEQAREEYIQKRQRRSNYNRDNTAGSPEHGPETSHSTSGRPIPPPPPDGETYQKTGKSPNASEAASTAERQSPQPLPEEKLLLRLMIEKGSRMIQYVLSHMALDEFSEGPVRKLVQCLMDMYKEGNLDTDRIIQGKEGHELQKLAASVSIDEYTPSENWEHRRGIRVPRLNEHPYETAGSAMTLLKLDRVDDAIQEVKNDIYSASRKDNADLTDLQTRLTKLTNLRKHIHNRDYLNDPPTG